MYNQKLIMHNQKLLIHYEANFPDNFFRQERVVLLIAVGVRGLPSTASAATSGEDSAGALLNPVRPSPTRDSTAASPRGPGSPAAAKTPQPGVSQPILAPGPPAPPLPQDPDSCFAPPALL